MNVILGFLTALSPLLQRLGACASAGFAAGSLAGFMLALQAFIHGPPAALTGAEVVQLSLALAVAAWLVIVFAFVVLGRVAFVDIWYSSFFNALLTCLFTVLLVSRLNLWLLAFVVGVIVGTAVGSALCHLGTLFSRRSK